MVIQCCWAGFLFGWALDVWIDLVSLPHTPNSKTSYTHINTVIVASLASPVNNLGHLKSVWMYQISLLPEAEWGFFFDWGVRSITGYWIYFTVTCLNSYIPGGSWHAFCAAVRGFLQMSSSLRHNFRPSSITLRHKRVSLLSPNTQDAVIK